MKTANDVAALFLQRANAHGEVMLTGKQTAWLLGTARREGRNPTQEHMLYGDGWTARLFYNGAALLRRDN